MNEIINSFGVLANFFPFNLINTRWGWTIVVFTVAFWVMLKFYEYRERRK